jgi:predicted methyltransferase
MKCTGCFLVLGVLLLGSVAGAGDTGSALDRALAHTGRSEADRARDTTSRPDAVMQFFGIEPGMRVLDLISGGGYYTEILSHLVGPAGEVVAHTNDIVERYSRDELARRYAGDRLGNVTRLISNPPNLNLPSESFDVVLMVLTYHDLYYVSEANPHHPKIDRDPFLAQVRRSLKPGGTLAIIDHAALPGTGNRAAQELHRIDEAFARFDLESAGFVFEASSDVLRNPDDDRKTSVFADSIRRRTDRFVYRFSVAREDSHRPRGATPDASASGNAGPKP